MSTAADACPLDQAAAHAAAWEDTEPEHLRRRLVLQQVSDAFVLAPVRTAIARGLMRGWPGDIGVDITAVPAWHHPPSDRRQLGSVETTAGWHFSAGATEGVFGHSLTLPVAASRRSSGKRISRHPQLALGAVLDTGGKRPGPNAVHTLTVLAELDLPTGILAADRAYIHRPDHRALPEPRPAPGLPARPGLQAGTYPASSGAAGLSLGS